MKKSMVILALLICGLSGLVAGSRETWIEEDFSSGTFPPAGWSIVNQAGNWSVRNSSNAGGSIPELRLNWSPQFNGTTYFVSPSVDTSGESIMYLDFRHNVDHYSSSYTIGVATRRNQAGSSWNTAWEMTVSNNISAQLKTVELATQDVGASDFQFAVYFSGNSTNLNYWYIDDIRLYTPFDHDLAIMDVDLPSQSSAGSTFTPKCTVANLGYNPLVALVSLNIYHGDELVYSQPDYHSVMLDFWETDTAEFPAFSPTMHNDLYRFEFSVSSLEDVVDQEPANNVKVSYVNTWTMPKQMVLLEIGTGGWCPYCPGAAMAADDFVYQGYNVAVIENHNGDPFANDDSNGRNNYYGVSAYPTSIFDGMLFFSGGSNTSSIINSLMPLFSQRRTIKSPLFLMIFGEESPQGYNITVQVEKLAPLPYPNLALHLALTESNIAYSWQGQNHMSFVNRGMYPDWEGTVIDLANAPIGSSYHTFPIVKDPSWAEENCELVAFVQNLDTKEVIQATKLLVVELEEPPVAIDDSALPQAQTKLSAIYPNPFSQKTVIEYSLKQNQQVELGIYNLRGQLVRTLMSETKGAGLHQAEWDGCDGNGKTVANGTYILRMKSGGEASSRKLLFIK
ncbi:MAG: T9SS type A sorting domain-containing protein [Candidatus Cloacimonetes bacterium]|mgnify:FL=1|nr:T9SS type A sorting domain-containing protein [Candidatus Cloacimonadota bacterium]